MKNFCGVVRCRPARFTPSPAFVLTFTLLWIFCGTGLAQKLAITFDDLPLNGLLPPGVTRVETAKNVLEILKKRQVPPVYGFVNAKKLEGNADGAEALKVWAAAEPVGNHTLEPLNADAKDTWHWFRYPFLHEGDTVEKRRAVRAYLQTHGYRIAQVTLDWEDYLWNTAYARCVAKGDQKSIEWLRRSYLNTAAEFLDLGREQAKLIYGREISYVLLMHLGAYSSTILPDALDLLKQKGFKLVTLEEAQTDAAYQSDPDVGLHDAGTLLDQLMQVKGIKYPEHAQKPYKEIEAVCQ
jgi:peptidoglycan/xylan/chitin deacetylase (PgdA/CDA1 family)